MQQKNKIRLIIKFLFPKSHSVSLQHWQTGVDRPVPDCLENVAGPPEFTHAHFALLSHTSVDSLHTIISAAPEADIVEHNFPDTEPAHNTFRTRNSRLMTFYPYSLRTKQSTITSFCHQKSLDQFDATKNGRSAKLCVYCDVKNTNNNNVPVSGVPVPAINQN